MTNSDGRNKPVSFASAVSTCFSKYFDFDGVASRSEYWLFTLFIGLSVVTLGFFEKLTGTEFLGLVFYLVLFLPHLTVGARRLRDAGFSPWWLLLNITIIGGVVTLVMTLFPSTRETARGGTRLSSSGSSRAFTTAPVKLEDQIYGQIGQELEGRQRDLAVWARAVLEAGGDESKARAAYISIRFENLMAEVEQTRARARAQQVERAEREARLQQIQAASEKNDSNAAPSSLRHIGWGLIVAAVVCTLAAIAVVRSMSDVEVSSHDPEKLVLDGWNFFNGEPGDFVNEPLGLELTLKAIQKSDPESVAHSVALNNLSVIYQCSESKQVRMYSRGREIRDQQKLNDVYSAMTAIVEGFLRLRPIADEGEYLRFVMEVKHPVFTYMSRHGYRLPKSTQEAYEWLVQFAAEGHVGAASVLGVLYECSEDRRDVSTALKWYRVAGELCRKGGTPCDGSSEIDRQVRRMELVTEGKYVK